MWGSLCYGCRQNGTVHVSGPLWNEMGYSWFQAIPYYISAYFRRIFGVYAVRIIFKCRIKLISLTATRERFFGQLTLAYFWPNMAGKQIDRKNMFTKLISLISLKQVFDLRLSCFAFKCSKRSQLAYFTTFLIVTAWKVGIQNTPHCKYQLGYRYLAMP